jgi:DNA-directed RNA polymerase subunit RPC12/RpoP
MKILIVPNLLIQYVSLEDNEKSEQKVDCDRCGFKMDKYTGGCQLKCFRCGLEITISE